MVRMGSTAQWHQSFERFARFAQRQQRTHCCTLLDTSSLSMGEEVLRKAKDGEKSELHFELVGW